MIKLSKDSWMEIVLDAVPCTTEQFNEMWATCPASKEQITMYGKTHDVPRFQKLFGEASYSFSGMFLVPDPIIPPLVQSCLDFARESYPGTFNGALVNYYPDGESYISPHSDDERDLDPRSPILSFSFGAERNFVVTEKKGGNKGYVREVKIPTRNGSMIAMRGRMQSEFVHGVPKATKGESPVGPRINVTVRAFRQAAVTAAQAKKKQKVDE
jgi:alkylated DNA repair dioxygenase AlkB